MTTHVQRVQDLIRLATNSGASEAEARTAAITACKLIARYGLTLSDPSAPQSRMYSPPPYNPPPTQQYYRPPPESSKKSAAKKYRTIYTKYTESCRICGVKILVNEKCVWAPGKGIRHIECAAGDKNGTNP